MDFIMRIERIKRGFLSHIVIFFCDNFDNTPTNVRVSEDYKFQEIQHNHLIPTNGNFQINEKTSLQSLTTRK